MAGLVKQGIPPVTNCLLQCLLADIVVQQQSGHSQKQRQLLPVLQQVGNHRSPQGRVGLDTPLVELPYKPDVEFLHRRAAFGLVKEQTFLGR